MISAFKPYCVDFSLTERCFSNIIFVIMRSVKIFWVHYETDETVVGNTEYTVYSTIFIV